MNSFKYCLLYPSRFCAVNGTGIEPEALICFSGLSPQQPPTTGQWGHTSFPPCLPLVRKLPLPATHPTPWYDVFHDCLKDHLEFVTLEFSPSILLIVKKNYGSYFYVINIFKLFWSTSGGNNSSLGFVHTLERCALGRLDIKMLFCFCLCSGIICDFKFLIFPTFLFKKWTRVHWTCSFIQWRIFFTMNKYSAVST